MGSIGGMVLISTVVIVLFDEMVVGKSVVVLFSIDGPVDMLIVVECESVK